MIFNSGKILKDLIDRMGAFFPGIFATELDCASVTLMRIEDQIVSQTLVKNLPPMIRHFL